MKKKYGLLLGLAALSIFCVAIFGEKRDYQSEIDAQIATSEDHFEQARLLTCEYYLQTNVDCFRKKGDACEEREYIISDYNIQFTGDARTECDPSSEYVAEHSDEEVPPAEQSPGDPRFFGDEGGNSY